MLACLGRNCSVDKKLQVICVDQSHDQYGCVQQTMWTYNFGLPQKCTHIIDVRAPNTVACNANPNVLRIVCN